MTDLTLTPAECILVLRRRAGMTQHDLAARTGR